METRTRVTVSKQRVNIKRILLTAATNSEINLLKIANFVNSVTLSRTI